MDVFSKRLRERARELELSDAEVARRAGLNERRYGHYVTGAREPDLETLVKICRVLGTTPNEMLGLENGRAGGKKGKGKASLLDRLMAAGEMLDSASLEVAVKQVEILVRRGRRVR